MGSTSQAQPASMRRCPGAAGPQYSMYPVDMRCAALNGEYLCGSKMVLQRCASLSAALCGIPAVRPTLVCSTADTFLWCTGTPKVGDNMF